MASCLRYVASFMIFGIVATTLLAGCASTKPETQQANADPSDVDAAEADAEVDADVDIRDIDAKADSILRQMCQTLDRAKALKVHVKATMDGYIETGQLAQFNRSSDITMVRPDRLQVTTDSDDGLWSAWQKGNSLTVLDRDANVYSTETVPPKVDEMLDFMADNYDLIMPMADLLIGNTYDSLMAEVESGSYLGIRTIDNKKCHHLLFRQESIDWQIWIDEASPGLPRKLVITYTEERDQPQYVAVMSDWNLESLISDEVFSFAPPADAQSVPMSDLVAAD